MLLHGGEDMQWQPLSLQKATPELALGLRCFCFYRRASGKSFQWQDRETGCGAELL
jgi:hypothetical protein